MAYIYLFQLYDKIDDQLSRIEQMVENSNQNDLETHFQKGRADLLRDFRHFLSTSLDHKLPRRMQKKLKNKS